MIDARNVSKRYGQTLKVDSLSFTGSAVVLKRRDACNGTKTIDLRTVRCLVGRFRVGRVVDPHTTVVALGAAGEVTRTLPGGDLLERADLTSTRALTIAAKPLEIWPWLVQMGEGRGGFYCYDFLENLLGRDTHSADTVVSQWQDLAVGDEVRLAPSVSLNVAHLEPALFFGARSR